MTKYRARIADKLLERKLKGKGAVVIEGPKWCGKTTTAEQMAASTLYMADADMLQQNLNMAKLIPGRLLEGKNPRLIDEWQVAPSLWDAVRFSVDHHQGKGLFILTGSAVPPYTDEIIHTGTGRFGWLTMRPMSLWESGDSNGSISLSALFDGPDEIAGTNDLSLERIAFLISRGGWPDAISMPEDVALDQAFDYCDAVAHRDISRVDMVMRNPDRAKRLMRSYARFQGSQATIRSIRKDMLVNDTDTLDEDTVSSYIDALRKIFVIEDMPAWNPNLRSKTAVRTSVNRYYIDPSIAAASIGAGPKDLIDDLETMGLFFETLCVRDLRVYADAIQGNVYHYRDGNGLECDAVIHLRNGSYALIEIKIGGEDNINAGAESLNKLESIIDITRMKAPAFKMVLTAIGKYAYRRKDEVYVVPIGCLKD